MSSANDGSLSERRQLVLDAVERNVGNTPLYEVWHGERHLMGNRIFAKAECENPTGSHYDRVFLSLFRHLRSMDAASCLVEVSSGNAAASFAWYCLLLGYESIVVLPPEPEIPSGFRDHIKTLNPNVEILTSPYSGRYMEGAVAYMREQFRTGGILRVRNAHLMNHSRHRETVDALSSIASESVAQLRRDYQIDTIDHCIVACGNGASVVGPCSVLKQVYPGISVTAFEPAEATVVGDHMRPASEQPSVRRELHDLYGTGSFGVKFPFIEDPAYQFDDLVTNLRAISAGDRRRARLLRGKLPVCVGTTSLVSLDIALGIIKDTQCHGKNFLVTLYDRGDKYWSH